MVVIVSSELRELSISRYTYSSGVNTQTVQYALSSTVNDGLLYRKGDGTLVVSSEYEDGEQYEGDVKLFNSLEAANQYIESTGSWALTPVEFIG